MTEILDGYETLCEGKYRVIIRSTVKRELEKKAQPNQVAGLEALLLKYAEGGPESLPKSKWAGDEGWFPSAKNKKIRLEAFKPWQLRAYGYCQLIAGKATFVITGVDTSKKQDKAKGTILEAAGSEAVRVYRELGGR